MPTPGPSPAGMPTALAALQKQIDRLARRVIDLAHIDQSGATDGQVPVWNDTAKVWEPGVAASPALWVSASAADPPPNGEPFWYRTDLRC